MSHKTSRKRGAWFALSMLGCCNGARREEMLRKGDTKNCMEHLSSTSNAVCSCVDESEGSTLSSYAYIPVADYLDRQIEVPYINRYPNLDISPRDERRVLYHFVAPLRPSEQSSYTITAYEKQLYEMEMKDLKENPINTLMIREIQSSESTIHDNKVQNDQIVSRNNNNEMFQRFHQRGEIRSVDNVRTKVLEEHAGWQTTATTKKDNEILYEDEDVQLPEALLHNSDDMEGYEEWRQSRQVVLKHLAGKHKK